MLKRLFDISFSILLLIFFAPLIIVLGLLIRLKMGAPVLFRQKRPGLRGKPFYLFKLRTMSEEIDREGNILDDQQRLSVLGQQLRKYSLDELPQLFNVLKGDLSFVGPRPLLVSYLERYSSEQARRHEVKPGITGWAQVNGRNVLTWEEKFALDVWYVDNQNLWLDLKILWLTLVKVFKAEGISQEGWATMPEFMGSEIKKSGNK